MSRCEAKDALGWLVYGGFLGRFVGPILGTMTDGMDLATELLRSGLAMREKISMVLRLVWTR